MLIRQAIQPDYDTWILKVSIPFIAVNYIAAFACLYMFGSVVDSSGKPIEGVWSHFYFSAVTFTTLGYGNIVPADTWTQFVAVIEALFGLIGIALGIGLVAAIAMKRIEVDEKE